MFIFGVVFLLCSVLSHVGRPGVGFSVSVQSGYISLSLNMVTHMKMHDNQVDFQSNSNFVQVKKKPIFNECKNMKHTSLLVIIYYISPWFLRHVFCY